MTVQATIKLIENFLHGLVQSIDTEIEPGLQYLKDNVPAAAIKIGEAILAAAVAGSPWASLVQLLISQSKDAGVALAEDAAKVALNAAQNNLIAAGTPHLVAAA